MLKDYAWKHISVALVAGLLGGAVSGRLLSPGTAMAQAASEHAKILRAERLEIVDSSGKAYAVFAMVGDQPNLAIGSGTHWVKVNPDGMMITHGDIWGYFGQPLDDKDGMRLSIWTKDNMSEIGSIGGLAGIRATYPNGRAMLVGKGLYLQDHLQKGRALFTLSDYGMPSLGFLDEEGNVTWSAH